MRILLANSFHYRRGGDSAQYLDLAEALEARGHEVAHFSMHHPENEASPWSGYWAPHIEYRGRMSARDRVQAARRSSWSGETRRRMALLVRAFRPDVAHFHSVHHHLTLSAVDACVTAGVPTVWTLHDYRTVCPATQLLRGGEPCERCADGRFWHGVVGRCKSGELTRSVSATAESYWVKWKGTLGEVDCYVAPSRFLGRQVLRMGLPARRVAVVPNPVTAYAPPQGERRGLLYVGRLSAEKGVDLLLEAVAGLDVTLHVVGDGPEAGRLRLLADRLHVRAVFEGWRDREGVRECMARAQLLCVPSICFENCPGVVLEAMAAGLPVVANRLGGITELLDKGQAGWLIQSRDADTWRRTIVTALDDQPLRSGKARRARERVIARHDPELFLDRIEGIYAEVCGAARGLEP